MASNKFAEGDADIFLPEEKKEELAHQQTECTVNRPSAARDAANNNYWFRYSLRNKTREHFNKAVQALLQENKTTQIFVLVTRGKLKAKEFIQKLEKKPFPHLLTVLQLEKKEDF